jgi:predicted RNA-binding Zn-ribbon protein involved in translation (DUF1610 family)
MLKFRCQHCGQRIAVPARHLGKLVTCAECGAPTHPLAEQLVQAKRPAPSPAPAAPAATPVHSPGACANCGQTIGRLQTSFPWQDQRVCGTCYHILSAESSLGGHRPTPIAATRVRAAPPHEPRVPTPVALREQVVRGLVLFIVGVVALYGALTLLRDLAGLIAVTAVAVLALVALYAVFRSRWARPRQTGSADAALVPLRQ